MNAVEARGLTKVYQRKIHALRSLDLAVPEGRVFGLLGPNGAGKTTLIKILLGLRRRTSGEAFMLGQPAGHTRTRRDVGYLPEDQELPPYFSGRRALEISCMLQGLDPVPLKPRADELLERLGLADRATSKIRSYSKGMKQRLGVIQAILHDPKLVLLDEPTDGVDPRGRAIIRDLVREQQQRGSTVFVNSHLLNDVELMCDGVAILHRGKVRCHGTIDALVAEMPGPRRYRFATGGEMGAVVLPEGVEIEEVDDESVTISVESVESLDALVNALTTGGVSLRGLEPIGRDLESLYLSVIDAAEES